MSSGSSSSSPDTVFIRNENIEQVSKYIDEICSDPNFLCANRELCGKNTSIYTNVDNVNTICKNIKQANQCENDFDECLVSTPNSFNEAGGNILTSFVNIIIPIPGAFDENANQKFLRLPALSSSKNPKSKDVCKLCACMNRFSTSPGSSNTISESSYTSPGQNTCIYPDFIEHFYYPISISLINEKLQDVPPIKLGKYTVFNSNIISAHSEDDLFVTNLYDLLIKNGILETTIKSFILNVLYKNDTSKSKELDIYIKKTNQKKTNLIKKGLFYENITFFYILIITMIFILIFTIIL
jgi:hypothetical protein